MIRGYRGWAMLPALVALVCEVPAQAQAPTLQSRVEAKLAEAGPGTRFGLVVATDDGRELVAISPEGRFVPASTTKMFTIAAVFADLPGIEQPDANGGASVLLERHGAAAQDVVLEGHGDARLSSAPGCAEDCLAALADAVAAKVREVGNVIGDDTAFPDQRWSQGMSWNNIPTASGTAASALTLDDNELPLLVTPSAPGQRPTVALAPYFILRNEAVTGPAGGVSDLDVERLPLSRDLRLTGTIAAGAKPQRIRLGIDDPADFAAWRLKALLEARGVRVTGAVLARHRPAGAAPPTSSHGELLARLTPPPLHADLTQTAKVSQNLHAELFLRRLARLGGGGGSVAEGVKAVRVLLDQAGVPQRQAEFSDGAGMSTYNRLSPRGAVTFLRWASHQPWGSAWREAFPVGGVDGTLARRFHGGPLQGRLFAKTGSLNQTSALVGYLVAKSGRTLAFAAFANDIPEGAGAVKAIDAALELVAAEN
ncbi:MAG TPA: D-alanyl-D-alanine carboxypeptidase/D-alanyl-D-alanine-endopeptidase [Allosphingosinicella sp.]